MDRTPKSKSLNSLTSDDCSLDGLCKVKRYNRDKYRRTSESSVEVYIVHDSASEEWCDEKVGLDSGLGNQLHPDYDIVAMLEQKLDKLNELFQEQCHLLNSIKEELHSVSQKHRNEGEMRRANVLEIRHLGSKDSPCEQDTEVNERARSLLNAIEKKQASCLDAMLRETLTDLINSDDFKQRLVRSTACLLRDRIAGTLSRDMSAVYLPVMQRFNKKLLRVATRTLEDAFSDLEDSSNMRKLATCATRALRQALDQHRDKVDDATAAAAVNDNALHEAIKVALTHELMRWRTHVLYSLTAASEDELSSPPQPPNPDTSIIDQLMRSAEIKKQIQDGDIAGSLSRALCANDLSLVVAACKGIDPDQVFRPCHLPANILLSLVQQLATDMVHDTRLKCRFLEESVIALSSCDRALVAPHIEAVCIEVKTYLSQFLQRFPAHAAATRLTLVLMAVDSLVN